MTKEELVEKTHLFLLDLDGTVYIGDRPLCGVPATLSALRKMGKKLVFLTNNSSKTEEEYRTELSRIGLLEEQDDVYTSGMVAMQFLKEHFAGKKVYLVGTRAVRAEFENGGIRCVDEDPDMCLLAYDTELTFEKIRKLDFFLRKGLPFLATHPDDVCPTADGSMPDVGSFLAMFARSSRRAPDRILGKPYTEMGEAILARYHLQRGQVCMVGDRLYTDIRFAKNNGLLSLLVLSGETTRESLQGSGERPDVVLGSLGELFSKNC